MLQTLTGFRVSSFENKQQENEAGCSILLPSPGMNQRHVEAFTNTRSLVSLGFEVFGADGRRLHGTVSK